MTSAELSQVSCTESQYDEKGAMLPVLASHGNMLSYALSDARDLPLVRFRGPARFGVSSVNGHADTAHLKSGLTLVTAVSGVVGVSDFLLPDVVPPAAASKRAFLSFSASAVTSFSPCCVPTC